MESNRSILLKDAVVVTVDETDRIVEGDVFIEGSRIGAVGDIDVSDLPDDIRTIELNGAPVLPGFIQPHIHLCQTLLRGSADDMALIDWLQDRVWPYEAALEPEEVHTSARLGLAELILGGTTTILDMGTVRHTDAIGQAVEHAGIRAFIGKCMMDRGERAPAALLQTTEKNFRESLELARRWDGAADGRIHYAFAPRFAISCTAELLRQTAEAAEDLDLMIHTHASETEFENQFAREESGLSNVAYLHKLGVCSVDSVFAHGVHVSDADCKILADTGTAVCHCPSSNLKLASGIADIPRYDDHGVQVALGADGAPCNNNLDAFVEMRLASLIQKPRHGPEAMPAYRALKLATIDGARALGIEDLTGSIEPGKAADLMVLDLDSDPGTSPDGDIISRIVYSAGRRNVRHVFANGQQLVEDGQLLGTDLPELLAKARQHRQSVFDRMD